MEIPSKSRSANRMRKHSFREWELGVCDSREWTAALDESECDFTTLPLSLHSVAHAISTGSTCAARVGGSLAF